MPASKIIQQQEPCCDISPFEYNGKNISELLYSEIKLSRHFTARRTCYKTNTPTLIISIYISTLLEENVF